MKRFSAIYIAAGATRRMTFEALDLEEARAQAVRWGVGVEGEASEFGPVKAALPEAFNLQDARRMLGGISRSKVYQMLDDGSLERVPLIRRLLVTRRSIERRATVHN